MVDPLNPIDKPEEATWYRVRFTEYFDENANDPNVKSWVWYVGVLHRSFSKNIIFCCNNFLWSNSKSDIVEQCFVRELDGFLVDYFSYGEDLHNLFSDSQALVGLIIDEYKVDYIDENDDNIPLNDKDIAEMHLKMKIYACDEEPDFTTPNHQPPRHSWQLASWRFVWKMIN